VEFRFQQGPLRGFAFECLSSHKYFLLGAKYEDHLQKKFAEVVGPNDIAFDIGAHFGWWTLWFSALCKHVVAFEPSPANFSMLQKNVASNRRLNVSLNNLAASDFAGMVPFVDDGSSSHIQNGGSASAANLKVRTIRIDDYAEGPPPTFVKIDVEGSAASVLRGMARTLEEQKPTVVCELHDASEESAVSALLFARSYHSVNLEKMDRFPKHVLARP
jgi:FkbM family methyltransferase